MVSCISGKMDQKRNTWAITGVLRNGKGTPRSGEGSFLLSEAERESWPSLVANPLFTAWKCYDFVSFCFSVIPKTRLLD